MLERSDDLLYNLMSEMVVAANIVKNSGAGRDSFP